MSKRPAGCQVAQVGAVELQRQLVFGPTRVGLDEHHRGLVAIFRLAADVAHGLVQQDGDALRLRGLGLALHRHAVLRRHLGAHGGHLAVHAHPAALDPLIRLAARAQAHVGQALVQAHRAVAGGCRRRGFRARRAAEGGGLGHGGDGRVSSILIVARACPVWISSQMMLKCMYIRREQLLFLLDGQVFLMRP